MNKSSIIITSTFEAEISETLESMGIRNFVSVHALPDIERMYLKEKKKSQQKDISKRAATRSPLLVSVGSEGLANRGWLITEQSFLDITQSDDWSACFSPNSIDAIFAEHVWEHMTTTQAKVATKLCFRYLKYGGRLRLAVPDGYHESDSYIERVKPGGYGNGSDDHKVLYNYQSFSSLLEDVGFKVELLEYYDENRNLHTATISENFGAIRRSVYNYPDNHTDKLNYDYSSLIIDAFKCPN
ncbi:MAG: hypothetical protein GJ680_19955 [Alteromonadaceae bacterium]|nr:hypothetical protein [Alteromonadaceae bacterium]